MTTKAMTDRQTGRTDRQDRQEGKEGREGRQRGQTERAQTDKQLAGLKRELN